MKPDWKDAPEWANWLAMDKDGSWWWYEEEPCLATYYRAGGCWLIGSGKSKVCERGPWWKETKEERV